MTAMFAAAQNAYAFYQDGTESGSTIIGSQDTSQTIDVTSDVNIGIRVRIQETGGANGSTTDDYQLQYSKNGGAFTNITASSSNVVGFNSSSLTDQGATTNRLGAGSGSFVAGLVSEDGLADNIQLTASNYTEFLYSVTLVAADVAQSDALTFRTLRNGSTMTYNITPTINVKKTQTLTPSLYTDDDTFFTHTVSASGGSQELTPSLYTDGDTFFTPKVSHIIYPSLYSDGDTFFTPQLNLNIFPSLYSDGDTFYSPTVAPDQALTASLFENINQFPPEPPIDTFWQITVTTGEGGAQNLFPDLYVEADTFYTPTVTPGSVNLSPSLFTNTNTFYTPSVIQKIFPSLYTDADTFFDSTVTFSNTLLPSLYTDADTFFSAVVSTTYNLQPSLYVDADTFYSPNIIQVVKPDLYTDADTFYSATVTPGAINLTPSLYVDADTFYTHDIAGDIKPDLYVDPDTFYSPKVSFIIYPSLYTDADTFYSSNVSRILSPSLYADGDTFYGPLVSQIIHPGLYTDADAFYTATILQTLYPALYVDPDTFYQASTVEFLSLSPELYTDSDTFFTSFITQFAPRGGRFPHKNPTFRRMVLPTRLRFK